MISTSNFSKESKVEQLRKKLKDLNSDPRIKGDPRSFIIGNGSGPNAHCDASDADDDAPNVR
jgi:hypothetical protein